MHLADGPVRGRFFVHVKTILLATKNAHKAAEIAAMLGPSFSINILTGFEPVVIEDRMTFEGNATKKAVTIANWLAQISHSIEYVLADDSGLEVDALQGAPGV